MGLPPRMHNALAELPHPVQYPLNPQPYIGSPAFPASSRYPAFGLSTPVVLTLVDRDKGSALRKEHTRENTTERNVSLCGDEHSGGMNAAEMAPSGSGVLEEVKMGYSLGTSREPEGL